MRKSDLNRRADQLEEASAAAARQSVENQAADQIASDQPLPLVRRGMGEDYYSLLERVVAAVTEDHEQLRAMVYELARQKLREELVEHVELIGRWGKQIRGLDAAIVQFESDCLQAARSAAPAHSSTGRVAASTETDPEYHPPAVAAGLDYGHSAPAAISVLDYEPPISHRYFAASASGARLRPYPQALPPSVDVKAAAGHKKSLWQGLFSTLQLVIAAAIGVALYAFADSHFSELLQRGPRETAVAPASTVEADSRVSKLVQRQHRKIAMTPVIAGMTTDGQVNKAADPQSTMTLGPARADFPMPNSYGAYAVIDGKLIDLDVFPIVVPDPRVAISGMFSKPSEVHIPAGPLQFVIFRRDLMNNAPDHVQLRVVARVERALTFSSGGKAELSNLKEGWIVRGSSYRLKVSPVPESPEMIVLRSENPQSILPSGRYALVVKNIAYDFTIDGKNSDSAHCLERTEALGEPVYTECRKS
jgi:hypothetical protein